MCDNLTRERFSLGEEEFKRVEETLVKAIEAIHLNSQKEWPGSCEEAAQGSKLQDQWGPRGALGHPLVI